MDDINTSEVLSSLDVGECFESEIDFGEEKITIKICKTKK
jgi:hypothetical protein